MSEKLLNMYNDYQPGNHLNPREKQGIWEGIMKKIKEFSSEIYITRCREKNIG